MDVNDSDSEDSEGSEEHGRENIYHLRDYLNHHQWTAPRNIDVKGMLVKEQRETAHIIGNWRKENPYYKMAETKQNYVL